MRMDEAFYNLFMYLYNKNVLEYAEIARSGPKSMIRDIEGLSNNYRTNLVNFVPNCTVIETKIPKLIKIKTIFAFFKYAYALSKVVLRILQILSFFMK